MRCKVAWPRHRGNDEGAAGAMTRAAAMEQQGAAATDRPARGTPATDGHLGMRAQRTRRRVLAGIAVGAIGTVPVAACGVGATGSRRDGAPTPTKEPVTILVHTRAGAPDQVSAFHRAQAPRFTESQKGQIRVDF